MDVLPQGFRNGDEALARLTRRQFGLNIVLRSQFLEVVRQSNIDRRGATKGGSCCAFQLANGMGALQPATCTSCGLRGSCVEYRYGRIFESLHKEDIFLYYLIIRIFTQSPGRKPSDLSPRDTLDVDAIATQHALESIAPEMRHNCSENRTRVTHIGYTEYFIPFSATMWLLCNFGKKTAESITNLLVS